MDNMVTAALFKNDQTVSRVVHISIEHERLDRLT